MRLHTKEEELVSSSLTSLLDEMENETMIRQAFYRLFSLLFQYPDMEMLAGLQEGAKDVLKAQADWKESPIAEKLQYLFEEILALNPEDRKGIVDEYNQLFLIKPKVPPYETTYLKLPGQSEGMIAAEVSGVYAAAGLAISPEFNQLPDHIAVELEFMSFLCEKELNAIQEDDVEALAIAQKGQRDFMDKHLAAWFPKFALKALEEADEDLLYHSVVTTVFAFLRNELEILEIIAEGQLDHAIRAE